MEGKDMLVNLTTLPKYESSEDNTVKIKRAFAGDKEQILAFIREHFNEGWAGEAECAILQSPGKCFIATENGKLLGFSVMMRLQKAFLDRLACRKTRAASRSEAGCYSAR